LRHRQPSDIDANQSCPIPDSDFAAILGRASGLLFLSSNDADYFGKKVRSDEFRDCTHILGLFVFRPEASLCEATNARIGLRKQVAERARTQTLSQFSNLLFLLSEVE
jgi:hypothetical protein